MRYLAEEVHSFNMRGAGGSERDREELITCCSDRLFIFVALVHGLHWYLPGVASGKDIKGRALVNDGRSNAG